MPFLLPALPYPKDSLLPHISPETLELHHHKHHGAYVDKLNRLVAGTPFEGMPLDQVIQKSSGAIFNNAAQAWNHEFYWNCMAAHAGIEPEGALLDAIRRDFGTFDSFRERFTEACVGHFASGWGWLVCDTTGRLTVLCTHDALNPILEGFTPLLVCDLWEHAYYADYRNRRQDYVANFWSVIDWSFVERNFLASREGIYAAA